MPSLVARLAALLLATLLVVAGLLTWHYRDFLATPLAIGEEGLVIELPRGAGLRQLSDDLATRGLIDSPDLLVLHGRLSGLDTALKVEDAVLAALHVEEQLAGYDAQMTFLTGADFWGK